MCVRLATGRRPGSFEERVWGKGGRKNRQTDRQIDKKQKRQLLDNAVYGNKRGFSSFKGTW